MVGGAEELTNLDDAKEKCSYNPLCNGIDDHYCHHLSFSLCYVGSGIYWGDDSCFHEKIGISLSISV